MFDPVPSPHPPLRYATLCVQSPLFTTKFLFLSCQVNQTPKPSSSVLNVSGTTSFVLPVLVSVVQSNLFNTDTKGTEPIVRFTEVSVL